MKISTASIPPTILRNRLSVALAIRALPVLIARAHANELDPVTISAPSVTIVGNDLATEMPIRKTTVKARIAADAETLRNDSGVVLLKDRDAAFEKRDFNSHAGSIILRRFDEDIPNPQL